MSTKIANKIEEFALLLSKTKLANEARVCLETECCEVKYSEYLNYCGEKLTQITNTEVHLTINLLDVKRFGM